jgi:ribosome-associated translation inhibitor RaiA
VSADPAAAAIEVHSPADLPRSERQEILERFERLARYTDDPIDAVRVTLRRPETRTARQRWVADASLVLNGRRLASHAIAGSAPQAAREAADRLHRQMRRVADAPVALRNDRQAIKGALARLEHERRHRPRPSLKPPDLRDIIPLRTAYPLPESTLDAVADLLDLDLEFLLFRHARTGEDVVVHRRDDTRIGLLHPPGSPLSNENDIVVPEPSRYEQPIPLAKARDEMDVLGHRFVYFIDAADGRGKVLYLRHDGDYGLVDPPPSSAERAA